MPETDRNELSTAQITSKLAQLKLVKDRSIKDIDTNLNEEETKNILTYEWFQLEDKPKVTVLQATREFGIKI